MKLSYWEPDLRTLHNWIENGEIDLQPNFQRGDVWPISKKRKLVDTILREWSIPPVHVVVSEAGALEVLDGQQRLTAIRDFIDGNFAVDGTIEPHDPRIKSVSGLRYGELPQQTRRIFDQYTLRVFRITEYRPEEPGELFYRLNQQIILTPGEQRNALFGPARVQLKELVSIFESFANSRESIGFSNARMAYDDVFAKLVFFLEQRSIIEKATEARISDRFKVQDPFPATVIDWSRDTITHFSEARSKSGRVKLNKATLLSWLLFYARFGANEPQPDFMAVVEKLKTRQASQPQWSTTDLQLRLDSFPQFISQCISLFVNRSSLRVSDVSSVLYRDFALWALYLQTGIGREIPKTVRVEDVAAISELSAARPHQDLESILEKNLNSLRWSKLR
jgi:Protein of unknown function DUF262